MEKVLDKIDIRILRRIEKNPKARLAAVMVGARVPSTIFRRILRLGKWGYVSLDRESEKGRTFCSLTRTGREAIGREEDPTTAMEARLP